MSLICLLAVQLPRLVNSIRANSQYYKVQYALKAWQADASSLSAQELPDVIFSAQESVRLEPSNAHYALALAKVIQWGRFWNAELNGVPPVEDVYLKAIKLRPNWALGYAEYANYLAYEKNRISDALFQLKKAQEYGPYLQEVLSIQLDVGFGVWHQLGLNNKQWLLSIVSKASESAGSYRLLKNKAKLHSKSYLVCRYLKGRNLNADYINVTRDFCV